MQYSGSVLFPPIKGGTSSLNQAVLQVCSGPSSTVLINSISVWTWSKGGVSTTLGAALGFPAPNGMLPRLTSRLPLCWGTPISVSCPIRLEGDWMVPPSAPTKFLRRIVSDFGGNVHEPLLFSFPRGLALPPNWNLTLFVTGGQLFMGNAEVEFDL